jgi:hypothetical protein
MKILEEPIVPEQSIGAPHSNFPQQSKKTRDIPNVQDVCFRAALKQRERRTLGVQRSRHSREAPSIFLSVCKAILLWELLVGSTLLPTICDSSHVSLIQISSTNTSLCTGAWTSTTSGGKKFCKKSLSAAGCSSIFSPVPSTCYRHVEGSVALYLKGTPDGFHPSLGYPQLGDSLSIWAGTTLVWDYAVSANCPSCCSPVSNALLTLNDRYYCSNISSTGNTFISSALFSTVSFRAAVDYSCSSIELRICRGVETATNEDVYVSAANISITPIAIDTMIFNLTNASLVLNSDSAVLKLCFQGNHSVLSSWLSFQSTSAMDGQSGLSPFPLQTYLREGFYLSSAVAALAVSVSQGTEGQAILTIIECKWTETSTKPLASKRAFLFPLPSNRSIFSNTFYHSPPSRDLMLLLQTSVQAAFHRRHFSLYLSAMQSTVIHLQKWQFTLSQISKSSHCLAAHTFRARSSSQGFQQLLRSLKWALASFRALETCS